MSSASTIRAGLRCVRSRVAAGVVVTGSLLASVGCGALAGEQQANEVEPVESRLPPVDNPRDIESFVDRPCDLLKPEQAAEFAIDQPPRELPDVFGGVDCEWRSSTAHVWVYISTSTEELTLEQVYSGRDSLPYLEVTELGGHPAVVSRTQDDLPVCDVDIKLAERQSVTVSYDSIAFNDTPHQGCVVGKRVAQVVLENVPPAS